MEFVECDSPGGSTDSGGFRLSGTDSVNGCSGSGGNSARILLNSDDDNYSPSISTRSSRKQESLSSHSASSGHGATRLTSLLSSPIPEHSEPGISRSSSDSSNISNISNISSTSSGGVVPGNSGSSSATEVGPAASKSYDSGTTTNERVLTPVLSRSTSLGSRFPGILRCPSNGSDNGNSPASFSPAVATPESDRILGVLESLRQETARSPAKDGGGAATTLLIQYERLLTVIESAENKESPDAVMAEKELRQLVLDRGIPQLPSESETNSVRTRVWKICLGVTGSDDTYYQSKANDDSSGFNGKIKDDGFRTFKGNEQFWSIVTEDMIGRVLRATAFDSGYVQGMNVLLGPFLRIMPEFDSFQCFHRLVTHHIPSYVTKNLEGVHRGIGLAKRCLSIFDPTLNKYLVLKLTDISVFSVKYVITMMANVQPLEDVIKIWDAIFAYGMHFSMYIFFAFLISMRSDIMAANTAHKLMRVIDGGTLHSELLIKLALVIAECTPADLVEELKRHQTLILGRYIPTA